MRATLGEIPEMMQSQPISLVRNPDEVVCHSSVDSNNTNRLKMPAHGAERTLSVAAQNGCFQGQSGRFLMQPNMSAE